MDERQSEEVKKLREQVRLLKKQSGQVAGSNTDEVQRNVLIIEVRELIEAAVGPTMARTLEL